MATPRYRQSRRCDEGIKESEGWRSESYQDGAGVWTIAYGHTKNARANQTCTATEGLIWYNEDVKENLLTLDRMFPGREFNQGQVDALVKFIHNFGEAKFRRYTLYQLIRDGASDHEICEKWIDYVYTIRDEDMDGDLDAMIDDGLPIRRYREMLLWLGFSWVTACAAANAGNLNLNDSHMAEWNTKGGLKEILSNPTPVDDVVRRAHSARTLLGEGMPGKEPALTWALVEQADKDLFEEPAPAPQPEVISKPILEEAQPALPEEPEIVETRRKVPGGENAKRAEDSQTVDGIVIENKGKELKDFAGASQHVTGIAAGVLMWMEKYNIAEILGVIAVILVFFWIYGKIREEKGKIVKAEGRAKATQPKL